MKKTKNVGAKVGAGLETAAAVAAAGFYFYGSKHAKNHRKIAAKWASGLKKEVMKEAKRLEHASPEAFGAIVDRVAKTYSIARSVDSVDLKRAVNELKANWEMVKLESKKKARKTVSRAKKISKKLK